MTHTDKDYYRKIELLKNLTNQDFLSLGMRDVAYVKPVLDDDNKPAFAVHAADGTPLTVMDDMSSALSIILNNELEPATLH